MWFRSLIDSRRSPKSGSARQNGATPKQGRAAPSRLQLEALEDRSLPSSYAVTGLGTLGGSVSSASDVSASGQVVGYSGTAAGTYHAFLWTGGTMTDLGTLGGANSFASAINDRGQVVGSADTPDGIGRAFLLTPEDSNGDGRPDRWFRDSDANGANDLMTALHLPFGATAGGASDINNAGAVVGQASDAAGHLSALLWTAAGATVLGTFGGENASATGINDAGQVVGSAQNAAAEYRAFLWDSSHGMTELEFPAGYRETRASAISPSGIVAGNAVATATESYFGFRWTPDQPNGTTGTMTALLGGDSTSAADVNDAGVVVGASSHYVPPDPDSHQWPNGGYSEERGRAWGAGGIEDLGLQTFPTGINAVGQIAGVYQFVDLSGNWYYSAILLTPPAPTLSVSDVSVVEGNSGTASAVFTVRLSAASDQTVTTQFATTNGTATASDYQSATGTLTFAPGETSKTVTVPVNGDRLAEPNETFTLNLSNSTGAAIADNQAVGTILDDELRVSITPAASRSEGNTGQAPLVFNVTLSAASDAPVTVDWATANGSATAGSDYRSASGRLTFNPGEITKTVTVLVNGDRLPESNETFVVSLSNATNATVATSQGVGTILDDEPQISISGISKQEGKKGKTTLFTFTVYLSAGYDQPVTMSFRTLDGTAKVSDGDYVAKTGALTFAPGETMKTITIEVKGDSKRESDEYFYLDLYGNSSNSWLAWSRNVGTILNDDLFGW